MSHCCESANSGKSTPLTPKMREFLVWFLPIVVLVVVRSVQLVWQLRLPCGPDWACRFRQANLRWAMILLCASSLLFLSVKHLSRSTIARNWFTNFIKE